MITSSRPAFPTRGGVGLLAAIAWYCAFGFGGWS